MAHRVLWYAASIASCAGRIPGVHQVPAGPPSRAHVVPEPPPAVPEKAAPPALARAAATVDSAGVVNAAGAQATEPEPVVIASLLEIGEVNALAQAAAAEQKTRLEAGSAAEDSKKDSTRGSKVDGAAKVADANAVAKAEEKEATAAGGKAKAAALKITDTPEEGEAKSQNETLVAPAARSALSELGQAVSSIRGTRRHKHRRVRPSPKTKKPDSKPAADTHHFHSLPPEEARALMLARRSAHKAHPVPHPEPIEFEEFTARERKPVKPEAAGGGLDVHSVAEWVRSHTPGVGSLLEDWKPLKAPGGTAQLILWTAAVLMQVTFFVVVGAFAVDYFSRALARTLRLSADTDASSTEEKPPRRARAEAPKEEEECDTEVDLR